VLFVSEVRIKLWCGGRLSGKAKAARTSLRKVVAAAWQSHLSGRAGDFPAPPLLPSLRWG